MPDLCLDGSHPQRIQEAEKRTKRAEEIIYLFGQVIETHRTYSDHFGPSYVPGDPAIDQARKRYNEAEQAHHDAVRKYIKDFDLPYHKEMMEQ